MKWLSKAKNKISSLRRAWNESEPKISMQTILELFSTQGELGTDLSKSGVKDISRDKVSA